MKNHPSQLLWACLIGLGVDTALVAHYSSVDSFMRKERLLFTSLLRFPFNRCLRYEIYWQVLRVFRWVHANGRTWIDALGFAFLNFAMFLLEPLLLGFELLRDYILGVHYAVLRQPHVPVIILAVAGFSVPLYLLVLVRGSLLLSLPHLPSVAQRPPVLCLTFHFVFSLINCALSLCLVLSATLTMHCRASVLLSYCRLTSVLSWISGGPTPPPCMAAC